MKKIYLFFLAAMLTACGVGQENVGAAGQAGDTMAVQEAGSAEGDESAENKESTGNKESIENEESTVTRERTYEKEEVLYSEPEGLSFRKELEKVQTGYASYYFEPAVGEQEREGCIEATDRMISNIDAVLPDFEIFVLGPNPSYGVSVSGNRLFLPVQEWDSVDYLAKVLLAGYAEWGNYGLAYGYADYLYKKAGFGGGEEPGSRQAADRGQEAGGGEAPEGGEAGGFLPMSAPELYDLNLLCFEERFGSAEDVAAAKNNACLFVREYLSSHTEAEFLELLSRSGTLEGVAQANEALEAFYAENGVECSLTDIRYQYGGLVWDYAAACKYACFHVARDWQDPFWEDNLLVSENFLHEDYGEARAFFECSEHEMGQYQELFGFDSYDDSLLVCILECSNTAVTGYYVGSKHMIYLDSVAALMHEYIHSLTYGHLEDMEPWWKFEGIAEYFSFIYDVYGCADDSLNQENDIKWVREYIDFIGRPIEIQKDFKDIGYLSVYSHGYDNPNCSHWAAASFVGYLVEKYGEQATIAYICSADEYNEDWDKSYDELVEEWNQYIEENYSHYSR